MCKIFVMPSITSETRDNAWKLIYKMADKMSVHPNNDGLGYAALSEDGNLFGERWHTNRDAFEVRETISKTHKKRFEKMKGFLISPSKGAKYNSFGKLELDKLAAITLHTRLATSGKEFENTHPFVDGFTSLIHNGVIRNVDELELKQSTCDSETILNEYVKHDVMNKPENMQIVANKLQGYYACGVFSRMKDVPILDIFKSDTANLYSGFVKELDTFVFTTMYGDLEEACRFLGFTLEGFYKVESGVLIRLNPFTGEVINTQEFEDKYITKKEESGISNLEYVDHGDWTYHRKSNTWFRKNRHIHSA